MVCVCLKLFALKSQFFLRITTFPTRYFCVNTTWWDTLLMCSPTLSVSWTRGCIYTYILQKKTVYLYSGHRLVWYPLDFSPAHDPQCLDLTVSWVLSQQLQTPQNKANEETSVLSHLFSQTHKDLGTWGKTAQNNLTETPRQPLLHYSSQPERKTLPFLSFSITVKCQSKYSKAASFKEVI